MLRDVEISPVLPTPFTTLADVKGYLNIAGAGVDALLTSMLAAATLQIEQYCATVISPRTVTERISLDSAQRSLTLNYAPAVALTSVSYDDAAQTIGDFRLAKATGMARRTDGADFACLADWVVVYSAGFAAVPEPIKQATRDLVKFAYDASQRDAAVQSLEIPDVANVTFAAPHMVAGPSGARLPGLVADMLEPYVLRYTP